MQKRMNKKAQDLSIGTLILIVLGIIVLVLLILGFSMGWSNLWEKINIFGGGSSIGTVATDCALAVTGNNIFDYCNFEKVKVDGKTEYVSCEDDRVKENFQGSLTCPKSEIDNIREKCNDLIAEAIKDKDTAAEKKVACEAIDKKVNDMLCKEVSKATGTGKLCDDIGMMTCAQYWESQSASHTGEIKSSTDEDVCTGSDVAPSEQISNLGTNQVCCKVAKQ